MSPWHLQGLWGGGVVPGAEHSHPERGFPPRGPGQTHSPGRHPFGENSFSRGTVSWRFSVIFFLTLRNLAKLQGRLS